MSKENKYIAIDFDGTLCINGFPDIQKGYLNEPLWNKVKLFIKELNKNYNCKLLLWTCRKDIDKDHLYLTDALNFCQEHNIILDDCNNNKFDKFYGQNITHPRKIYADYYIDDKSISIEEFLNKSIDLLTEM